MADIENKIKEVAGQAQDVAKDAVSDVKVEAQQFKADAKGYAQSAFEDVKSEGKEVVEELKAAVKGQTLDSASTVGGAGYRATEEKPNGLTIASVVIGALSILFPVFWGLGGVLGGAIAAVLGAKARKDNQTKLATIGLILGAVGFVFGVIRFIF